MGFGMALEMRPPMLSTRFFSTALPGTWSSVRVLTCLNLLTQIDLELPTLAVTILWPCTMSTLAVVPL